MASSAHNFLANCAISPHKPKHQATKQANYPTRKGILERKGTKGNTMSNQYKDYSTVEASRKEHKNSSNTMPLYK